MTVLDTTAIGLDIGTSRVVSARKQESTSDLNRSSTRFCPCLTPNSRKGS